MTSMPHGTSGALNVKNHRGVGACCPHPPQHTQSGQNFRSGAVAVRYVGSNPMAIAPHPSVPDINTTRPNYLTGCTVCEVIQV